jgi:ATP-dependent DNA helicase RecG
MVAFANTNTGDILIGVEDDGTIRGVENVRATKEDIANIAHGKCDPSLTPKIFTVKFKQGTVVGIHIEVGTTIHLANNVPYIRRNSTTRRAKSSELDQIRERRKQPIGGGLNAMFSWGGDEPVVR